MSKLKKLKIYKNNLNDNKADDLYSHFDKEDLLLAKEHLTYYLISPGYKPTTSRLYLSYEHSLEYYYAFIKIHKKTRVNKPKKTSLFLFNKYPSEIKLIKKITYFIDNDLHPNVLKDILRGLDIVLEYMTLNKVIINDILDFSILFQKNVYSYCNENKIYYKSSIIYVRRFFGMFFEKLDYFELIENNKDYCDNDNSTKGLSSTTVYALDYYARKELDYIISNVMEYREWLDEFKEENSLFSLENLSYTYFKIMQEKGSSSGSTLKIFRKLGLKLYSIDIRSWSFKKNNLFYYKNQNQKKIHNYLIELSKKGKDISIENEKFVAIWLKELFPEYPFSKKINIKYEGIYTNSTTFLHTTKFRLKYNHLDLFRRIVPTIYDIQPLVLLLLIREGCNSDVLFNISVYKNSLGKFTLGNESGLALSIESKKLKSNSIIDIVIPIDSPQKRYLDFYLDWLQPLYQNSKSNNFFQNINLSDKEKIYTIWSTNTLIKYFRIKNSFYDKYEIFNLDGSRLNHFKHTQIRVYSNYADFLKGLSQYERQLEKGHKDLNTQLFYENSKEWKEGKKLKIFNTQNKLINYFNGIINRSNENFTMIFEGPLSDCINNREPSYLGSKKLNKSDICSDWFKCLTMCDKSSVIPKIHGPVIYAWISYMENERIEYIRDSDWEKEFKDDFQAANDVILGFTDEEKDYCKNNQDKHKDFVKMKFFKKLKNSNAN